MQTKKRYKVNLYYGGESPDSICWCNHLADAKMLAYQGEHAEIIDTWNDNKLIDE